MSRMDSLYVRAFVCGNERLQRDCYMECRKTFGVVSAKFQASSDDLKDIFHESFETLWSNISSGIVFVEGTGVKARGRDSTVRPVDDLTGAYFSGIVRNRFLEFCRTKGRIATLSGDFPGTDGEPSSEDPDDDIEGIKERLTMRSLNSLARSCIEILTKFYHESKSLDEILAERPENTSYDGLKSRKAKCLKTLKEKIITSFKANGLSCP